MEFTGQNGKQADYGAALKVKCGGKGKKAKRGRGRAEAGRPLGRHIHSALTCAQSRLTQVLNSQRTDSASSSLATSCPS